MVTNKDKNNTLRDLTFVFTAGLLILFFTGQLCAEPVFLIKPSFSISEIYDDNILSGQTDKDWDIYTAIDPSLEMELSLKYMDLFAGYSPSFLLFPKHFKNANVNEIAHDVYFEAKTEFSGGLLVGIKDRYYTMPVTYTEADFSPSNVEHTNEARFFATYNLGLSQTVDLDASVDFSRFDSATSPVDGILTNGQLSLIKSFNSIFRLGLINKITKYWYDDLGNDPFIYGLGLEPRVYITPHIKGTFPFGYRYLVLNQTTNESAFTYRINFDYEKNDEVIASVYYGQEFLVDLIGNSFDTWTLGANFSQEVVERVWIRVNVAYTTYKDKSLPNASNTTKILSTNPSLEYELGRDFSISVGYNGFFNKWGNAAGDFSNNRVFVMFSYQKNK